MEKKINILGHGIMIGFIYGIGLVFSLAYYYTNYFNYIGFALFSAIIAFFYHQKILNKITHNMQNGRKTNKL